MYTIIVTDIAHHCVRIGAYQDQIAGFGRLDDGVGCFLQQIAVGENVAFILRKTLKKIDTFKTKIVCSINSFNITF